MRQSYPDPFGGAAIVVGASEGIGLAVAVALYRRGISVGLISRSADKLAAACVQVRAAAPHSTAACLSHVADVTDEATIKQACSALIAQLGKVSLVFSSAGYTLPGYVDALEGAQYRAQWEHNCLGALHVMRAVLPHFRAQGGGHFVGTASVLGLMGMFGYSAYASSKFALVGLLHSLRAELAPERICVSVLCPPAVDTPGFARENSIKPAEVLAAELKAGVVSADDVAYALLSALPRGRAVILPTFSSRMIYLAYRLVPGIVERWLTKPAAGST